MLTAYSVQNDLLSIRLRHFQALRDFPNKYYELQDILSSPKLFRLGLAPVNKEEEITTPIFFYVYQQIQKSTHKACIFIIREMVLDFGSNFFYIFYF